MFKISSLLFGMFFGLLLAIVAPVAGFASPGGQLTEGLAVDNLTNQLSDATEVKVSSESSATHQLTTPIRTTATRTLTPQSSARTLTPQSSAEKFYSRIASKQPGGSYSKQNDPRFRVLILEDTKTISSSLFRQIETNQIHKDQCRHAKTIEGLLEHYLASIHVDQEKPHFAFFISDLQTPMSHDKSETNVKAGMMGT